MSTTRSFVQFCALAASSLILCTPHAAQAIQLDTQVTTIYQVGFGAGVMLGHAATGVTNYNKLTVGGNYTAQCASPQMLPTSGQRTLSRENVVGGLSLTTTIPLWVPTLVNMPGFNAVPGGTTLACTYGWASKAVESGYSVGAGGISYQTGNGERADGGTQLFTMIRPRTTDADGSTACIP